jgi:prepilin-type processing-associated H-X9-DG protein
MIHDFELDGYPINHESRPLRPRWQIGIRGLMKLVLVLACIFWLILSLSPVSTICERSPKDQCASNLRQIRLALESYHQQYGALPPAYIADASGRPMHSWRVLILPFMEQSDLYDQYDFAEPWDGPHNIQLLGKMPGLFRCPSRIPAPKGMTSYVAITGPGTMFPGKGMVKFADVIDGASRTLMVVETANADIPWTAPEDLDIRPMSFRINDTKQRGISSRHRGGANIVYGDGHAYLLKDGLNPRLLRSLITIAGGDGNPYDDGSPSF